MQSSTKLLERKPEPGCISRVNLSFLVAKVDGDVAMVIIGRQYMITKSCC